MIVTLILCLSGWKHWIIGRISLRSMLLFFVLWLVCSQFVIPITDVMQWNGTFLWCIIVVILAWFNMQAMAAKFHVLLAGIMLGVLYFLLKELFIVEPVYQFYMSMFHVVMSLGFIVVLLYRSITMQLMACSLALLTGDALEGWFSATVVVLGDKPFQDHWWLMFLTIRAGTEGLGSIRKAYTSAVQVWNARRRG